MSERPVLVALGASAGGLEALSAFLSAITETPQIAFVVLQHLSPEHPSVLTQLLARQTSCTVREPTNDEEIQPGTVYVIPRGRALELREDPIRFRLLERSNQPRSGVIDHFFGSAGPVLGERFAAVVLSGTGTDGSRGIRIVKQHGGVVLTQDEATARFSGMPLSAKGTGLVDFSGSPAEVARTLESWFSHHNSNDRAPTDEGALDQVLRELETNSGIDFRAYKETTVRRRIQRRMSLCSCDSLESYLQHVRVEPDEQQTLVDELLIGVTSFFRDPAAFEALDELVIRPLVKERKNEPSIRIWVAGCSTGEEAYSLAILFREAFRTGGIGNAELRVFATDISQRALRHAGQGVYPEVAVRHIPEHLVKRYFAFENNAYRIRSSLRRDIVFAQHNLLSEPPFTRMDLISCRNVLIYLKQSVRDRVLNTLHFSLQEGGVLLLGESESLGAHSSRFNAFDNRRGIYRAQSGTKAPLNERISVRRRIHTNAPPHAGHRRQLTVPAQRTVEAVNRVVMELFDCFGLVTDSDLRLQHVGQGTEKLLRVRSGAMSWRLPDLLEEPLSSSLMLAANSDELHTGPVRLKGLAANERPGADQYDVLVQELQVEGEPHKLFLFSAPRKTRAKKPKFAELSIDRARRIELSKLQADLRSSQDRLQATIEELETSNEELQVTNEELLSANEELQATNEELQTLNSEQRSLNHELEGKVNELHRSNADMDNLLHSTRVGSVFLDADLNVRRFTEQSRECVKILKRDLGRPIVDLRTTIVDVDLEKLAKDCLLEDEPIERVGVSEDGRQWMVRGTKYTLRGGEQDGAILTFVDVTAISEAYERAQSVIEALPHQIAMLDTHGNILAVNRTWIDFGRGNGVSEEMSWIGTSYLDACHRDPEANEVMESLQKVIRGEDQRLIYEYPCHSAIEQRWFLMQANHIAGGGAVVTHTNITARKLAEIAVTDMATHDPLTGLLNRRGLEEVLESEERRADRSGAPVFALFIDCDDFKKVNDNMGHAVGDLVLRSVAQRMRGQLRGHDQLARVGGDEFVAVLPDTRLAEALAIAGRLRDAHASRPIAVSHRPLTVTLSIAVTALGDGVHGLDDLLAASSSALSAGKQSGKNRVTLSGGAPHDRSIAPAIGQMKHSEFFRLLVQPIVDLEHDRVSACELLSRGTQPDYESPLDFFRAADAAGELCSVDLACLKACAQACRELPEHLTRHLNIYPSTLLATGKTRLLDILRSAGSLNSVCLEISEQQILGDPSTLQSKVAGLRSSGIRFAIDDVGFGQSSLESLIVLEPEVVKIDRRLVHGLATDPARQRAFERLQRIGNTLGCQVIAEGLELEEDRHVVESSGVRFAQGWLLGRPSATLSGASAATA